MENILEVKVAKEVCDTLFDVIIPIIDDIFLLLVTVQCVKFIVTFISLILQLFGLDDFSDINVQHTIIARIVREGRLKTFLHSLEKHQP